MAEESALSGQFPSREFDFMLSKDLATLAGTDENDGTLDDAEVHDE